MDGLSKITYKGKEIIYIDYSGFKFDKTKTLSLIYSSANEYMKYPFKSVLAIVNLANLYFDNDIINAFKATQEATALQERKVALIGLKGLQTLGYNHIIPFICRDWVRVFNNISEAKEWLVQD